MSKPVPPPVQILEWHERLYHRDQLRSARYTALADAEGFHEVCFAIEALGMRLLGKKADLGKYKTNIADSAKYSVVLTDLSGRFPGIFSTFNPLFEQLRCARNDAMHTGVYARHATTAAIELCIGLEDALMAELKTRERSLVKDFMVKSPICVDSWQPVAHARQLMLTHSFSFLPVWIDAWKLLSEASMARYIQTEADLKLRLAASIDEASQNDLRLIDATVVELDDDVRDLLKKSDNNVSHTLWLVQDENKKLCGVLSPFELM